MYSAKVTNGALEVNTSSAPYTILQLEYRAIGTNVVQVTTSNNTKLFNQVERKFTIPVNLPNYHVKLFNSNVLVFETIGIDSGYLSAALCSTVDDVVLGAHTVLMLLSGTVQPDCSCDVTETVERYLLLIEKDRTDCYGCN